MSTSYQSDYARAVQRQIIWDETRSKAAGLLALGYPKSYVANEVGISRNTVYAWLDDPEFAGEVDRLSLMVGVANRSERVRMAMRVIRSRLDEDGVPRSDKDSLDWLKFAQSETDGAKLDFSKLAELLTGHEQDGPPGPTTSQSSSQSPALLASVDSVIDVEVSNGPSSSTSDELDFNPS